MTAQEFLIENYLIKFGQKFIDYIPKIPKETNHYAVLVEPRLNHKILHILKNHMYFLNESESNIKWGLQIFHGINNEDQIKYITKDWLNVEYVNMEVDNFTKITFNQYLKTPNFWKKVKGDKVLLFQMDSILLRHGIDEFLEYDYVGAPWTKPKEGNLVGNGGLSLRNKHKMLEICEKYIEYDPMWEDIFFTKYVDNTKLPDLETAMKFSVEDVFYPTPFGMHNPNKTSPYLIQHILDNSQIKL